MQKSSFFLLCIILMIIQSPAQVLTPAEIKDPVLHALQEKHIKVLQALGEELKSQKFPYPFYFSRRLDIDEKQQQLVDQRSIRFDKFEDKTVLEITGNYYAAYSNDLVSKQQRAKQTFQDVMLPMLQSAIPFFQSDPQIEAYALEVSHHVRKKVLGVTVEKPENLVVVLPREAAIHFIAAKNLAQQQAALIEGSVFVDAEPFALWMTNDVPDQIKSAKLDSGSRKSLDTSKNVMPIPKSSEPSRTIISIFEITAHDTSGAELERMKKDNQELINRIVRELDVQAHFVNYAPPNFISFHHATYIQFSVNTTLESNGSRYKIAALAFDEHISSLLRPLLSYVKDESIADGISFSSSVHTKSGTDHTASVLSVEYFFPLTALRCFVRYDCTSQQLLDSGFVLINGERASLNLQTAEN